MRKKTSILFFAFLPALVCGQEKIKWEKDNFLILKTAYHSQIHSGFELGMLKVSYSKFIWDEGGAEYKQTPKFYGWFGNGLSFELELTKPLIFAPKLFSVFHYRFFSIALNLTSYTDFKRIDLITTPEVGLDLLEGLIRFSYGYNIHLLKNRFNEIGAHKFMVSLCLPLDITAEKR